MAVFLDDLVSICAHSWPVSLPLMSSDDANRLLITFNAQTGVLASQHGKEFAGRMVWGIYGPGGLLHGALVQASEKQRISALRSLKDLYLVGFAPNCSHKIGEEWPTMMDLACYMLWDMDGGLKSCCFQTSYSVEATAIEVLRTCLQHESEALQESALHALGHLRDLRPDVSVPLVNAYLAMPGHSPAARAYALHCREGAVQ